MNKYKDVSKLIAKDIELLKAADTLHVRSRPIHWDYMRKNLIGVKNVIRDHYTGGDANYLQERVDWVLRGIDAGETCGDHIIRMVIFLREYVLITPRYRRGWDPISKSV